MKARLAILAALTGLLAACQTVEQKLEATRLEADRYRGCLTSAYRLPETARTPAASPADVAEFAAAAGLPPPPARRKAKEKPVKPGKPVAPTAGERATAFATAEATCQPQSEAFHQAVLKTGASKSKAEALTTELTASMRSVLVGPAQ